MSVINLFTFTFSRCSVLQETDVEKKSRKFGVRFEADTENHCDYEANSSYISEVYFSFTTKSFFRKMFELLNHNLWFSKTFLLTGALTLTWTQALTVSSPKMNRQTLFLSIDSDCICAL